MSFHLDNNKCHSYHNQIFMIWIQSIRKGKSFWVNKTLCDCRHFVPFLAIVQYTFLVASSFHFFIIFFKWKGKAVSMWVFCGEMNTKCNNVSCILYITEYHKFKQYNILTTIPTGITYKHTHTQIHTKYNDKKPAPDIQLKKIYSDKFLEKQQKNIYNTFILILSSFKLRSFFVG